MSAVKRYRNIRVSEEVFERIFELKSRAMVERKRNISYDELLTELLEVYISLAKEAEKRGLLKDINS